MIVDLHNQLDERAALAFASLRGNQYWNEVQRWISDRVQALRLENDEELDATLLRQRQGAIQFGEGIAKAASEAPQVYERFRAQPR